RAPRRHHAFPTRRSSDLCACPATVRRTPDDSTPRTSLRQRCGQSKKKKFQDIPMKTIGLIGGMSWESTIPYYRQINELIKVRLRSEEHTSELQSRENLVC